jgi:serine phosphatase RsbU (regulator of sigma subunit)
VERTNPEGEHFGEVRLLEYVRNNAHLGSEAFTRRLIEKVRNFGQGKDFDDDVTLAVVRHGAVQGSND